MGHHTGFESERFGAPRREGFAYWRSARRTTQFGVESATIRSHSAPETILNPHRHLRPLRFGQVFDVLYEYPARLGAVRFGARNGYQGRTLRTHGRLLRSRLP